MVSMTWNLIGFDWRKRPIVLDTPKKIQLALPCGRQMIVINLGAKEVAPATLTHE